MLLMLHAAATTTLDPQSLELNRVLNAVSPLPRSLTRGQFNDISAGYGAYQRGQLISQ